MYWYLVIPFALGIFLTRLVVVEWQVALPILLLGMFLLYVLVRLKANVLPLLVVNGILMGVIYTQVRQSLSDCEPPATSSLSSHVSFPSALSSEHRAELSAMLLGDRSQLTPHQRRLYREAGASHLLALSGTHLGILLAVLGIFTLPRVRFSRWRWIVLLGLLVLLWSYTLSVGLPKSLLRASLMTSLFLLGSFSMRSARSLDNLGTSVLIMLLLDPLCAFDIGAQLSVSALVGITGFCPALNAFAPSSWTSSSAWWMRPPLYLLRLFFVSLSAWLFTLPLVSYYFHEIQMWQPLTGLILIPSTSIILYGALLLLFLSPVLNWLSASLPVLQDACTYIVSAFTSLQSHLMSLHTSLLHFCASLPLSSVRLVPITLYHLFLMYSVYLVTWILLSYRSRRVLLHSILVLLLLFTLLFLF